MQRINHISIPKPCHEQWQNMTPDGAGRYCQSCAKTVVDFTVMTNDEVLRYFKEYDQLCGRFEESQLRYINRELQQQYKPVFSLKRLSLAASLLLTLPVGKVMAQTAGITQADTAKSAIARTSGSDFVIHGTIIDSLHNVIPGATINIKGTEISAVSGIFGEFTLHAPPNADTLEVHFMGYKTLDVKLNPEVQQSLRLIMFDDPSVVSQQIVVGGAYVRRPFLSRVWYRFIVRPIKSLF